MKDTNDVASDEVIWNSHCSSCEFFPIVSPICYSFGSIAVFEHFVLLFKCYTLISRLILSIKWKREKKNRERQKLNRKEDCLILLCNTLSLFFIFIFYFLVIGSNMFMHFWRKVLALILWIVSEIMYRSIILISVVKTLSFYLWSGKVYQ